MALGATCLAAYVTTREANRATQLGAVLPLKPLMALDESGVTMDYYTCGTTKMKLKCNLVLGLSLVEESKISVKYFPSGDDTTVLWTSPVTVYSNTTELEVPVFRLRSSTDYTAEVYVLGASSQDCSVLLESTFTTASTGYSKIDSHPFANVTQYHGPFSYDVLVLDMGEDHDDFEGLIGLDKDGYVVWYYETGVKTGPFDQNTDTFHFGMIVYPGDGDDVEGSKSETSRLVMVSPDGEDQVENAVFCHGPGSNFKTVTHECRYVGDNKFLSIHQQAERSSEGITAKGTTYHHFLAESVVEWDTGSNTLAELKHFDESVSHDVESGIIPMILAAQEAVQARGAKLTMFASPWSPPWWMKAPVDGVQSMLRTAKPNGLLHSMQRPYANYFSKFISAYARHGIDLWGVTVQNEPEAADVGWEKCLWTPAYQAQFVKNHLGPVLHA